MATILRQLPNNFYTSALGVVIFYPLISESNPGVYGPGHRLGDCDAFGLTMAKTEIERKSKEHNILTTVLKRVSDLSVTVDLTVMQLSPIVRAASIMSSVGVHSQVPATALELELGNVVPGVYKLPDYGIEAVALESSSVLLVNGVDYLVDLASGQIEMLVARPNVLVTYDRSEISDSFIAAIGSNTSLRGMLVYRGTNESGVKSMVVLRDVQVSASGARNFIGSGADAEGVALQGIAAPVSGVPGIIPGTEIGFETDVPEAA